MEIHDKVTVTVLTDAGGISRLEGVIVGKTHIVPPRYDVRITKDGAIKQNVPAGQITAKAEKAPRRRNNVVVMSR